MISFPRRIATEFDGVSLHQLNITHADEMASSANENRLHLGQHIDDIDKITNPEGCRQLLEVSDLSEHHYIFGLRKTGQLCGIVTVLGLADVLDSAEIGYWLARSETGNGYMQGAVAAIIPHVQRNYPASMRARIRPSNHRSIKVATRNDFTFVRSAVDMHIYERRTS